MTVSKSDAGALDAWQRAHRGEAMTPSELAAYDLGKQVGQQQEQTRWTDPVVTPDTIRICAFLKEPHVSFEIRERFPDIPRGSLYTRLQFLKRTGRIRRLDPQAGRYGPWIATRKEST